MKALLVDLDGTLIDSLPVLFQCYCDFLASHGQQGTQKEFDELNGTSLLDGFGILQKRYDLEVDFSRLMLEYGVRLLQAYYGEVELFPGGLELLEQVRAAGTPIALVTSADRRLVDACLKGRNFGHLFDHVVALQSDESPKPDPAIYRRALSLFGIDPEEALAIEDSPNGVRAARDAGIPTFQIQHGEGHGWSQVAIAIDLPA